MGQLWWMDVEAREGAKQAYLEAYLEKCLVLSTLIIFTWQIAERLVHQYGLWVWKCFKAQYAPELPIQKEPLNPPPKPIKGVVH